MRAFWSIAFVLPALAQPPVGSRPFRLEELKTPPGFDVALYARVPAAARLLTFGPNNALYVAAGESVYAIPQASTVIRAASGFSGAHSVVFRDGDLYVAAGNGVYRLANAVTSDLVITSPAQKILDLPTGGQHSTRTLVFGADGRMYVSAGSTCNFCIETDSRRAAIMQFASDGSGLTIFGRGLRNSVGLAWHPVTGDLWATDNGGDGLGNDIPPDEINIIRRENDYGWPDCYDRQKPANWGPQARPDRCSGTVAPEVELQAHSAPLGISFYTGAQFPVSYTNDAFVAFHGSWNRDDPTGYKVVRVHASTGRGAGYEDFLWGFFDSNTRTESGRPVHAVNGPDGALYVSDDATGNIYRVAYSGPRINLNGFVQRAPGVYELYGENFVNADASRFSIDANGIVLQPMFAGKNQVNFTLPEGLTGDVTMTVKNEKASDQAVLHVQ
jgi:glucose/arabinose dehydrogenase